MKIKTIKLIYFSPTKTTRKIVHSIAEGTGISSIKDFDLAPSAADSKVFETADFDLAIIGSPVYAGRIPGIVKQRLKQLSVDHIPAVIVAVYGNRDYDDALLELTDLAERSGFIPVAGGVFIGEHSFADKNRPIAMGRPDTEDQKKALDFGALVKEKLSDIEDISKAPRLEVPGEFPYKELPKGSENIPPETVEDLCTICGNCASVCPTTAITIDDTVTTAADKCISCCACIKYCPAEARVLANPRTIEITEWLYTNFQERKEPEVYGV